MKHTPGLAWSVLPSTRALHALVLAALYAGAMLPALAVTRLGGAVSPIWIPSAILGWALIRAPTRAWPELIGAAALAHLAVAYFVQRSPLEPVYLAANMASPAVLAGLQRWRGGGIRFEHANDALFFLLFAGGLAPACSTLIVAAAGWIAPNLADASNLGVWFLSDSLSFLVFVPIIDAIVARDWPALLAPSVRGRTLLLFAVLIAILLVAFNVPSDIRRIVLTMLLPYMIYVTFSLGAVAARAAVALAAIMLVGDLFLSPTGHDIPPREFILFLQIYLAAMCASVLPLAAALAERQRLFEAASTALHDAQDAWAELIAAEAHYRLIADYAGDLILTLARDGTILFASPACRALSAEPDALPGRKIGDLATAEDLPVLQQALSGLTSEADAKAPRAWRIRLRDVNAAWRLYDARASLIASHEGGAEEFVIVLREAPEPTGL